MSKGKASKQNFLYGATILMVSMIIVKIIGAIFKIPLQSIIDATGMAYFSSAYTLFTTVYALTVSGLSAGVARMVAENATVGRYRDVKKILKLSTTIFFVLGVLGFGIIAIAAQGFSNVINSPKSYWSLVMISPAIFFCCIMASYRGYYEGLSDMRPTAVSQVVEVIIKLVAGLSFASLVMNIGQNQYETTGVVFGVAVESAGAAKAVAIPFGAAGAMFGITISTVIGFVYIYIRHKIKGDGITKEQISSSPRALRGKVLVYRLIKLAVPITLGAVVLQLSAMIDMVTIMNKLEKTISTSQGYFDTMFGAYLKDGEIMHEFLFGCFSVAVNIFNLVPAFTNLLGKSALPNVTAAWTERNKSKIKINIESIIRMTMLIAAPAGMGIAFLAQPVLSLLYKSSTGVVASAAPTLTILGVGAIFLALVTPVNAILQGIGRVDLPVKFMFVGAMAKLLLNLSLVGIESINIKGAAISTLVCYLIITVLSITKLKKICGIKLDMNSIILKPVIAGVGCGVAAFLSHKALSNVLTNGSIVTLASIAVAGVCYIILLALLNAISKDDVLMLPKGNKILSVLEKFRIVR